MKFYIHTMGCQMNVADSEAMASYLLRRGMTQAEGQDGASLVILNTCSVRQLAELKAASFLGLVKHRKRENPGLKVVLAGCMAQRTGEGIKKKYPFIDLVVGAKEAEFFPELFERAFPAFETHGTPPVVSPAGDSPVSAFVTAMRGCGNFCSYCIVPYVRGEEKSRTPEEIEEDVRALVASGTREVTLLGQNVNSYRGLSSRSGETNDFADLLATLNRVEGLSRIRFMTSHPKDLNQRLIGAMADLPKVCPHLHLPLQSGSDRVLAAMNRSYTAADYRRLIGSVRARIPHISFTTDILVGFPGESDEDFRQTLGLIREVEYDFLFAFKYSVRPGTAAAKLPDDVPQSVKEDRLAQVLETANGIAARRNAGLVGSVQEVLAEGKRDDMYEGRSPGNRKVFFSSDDDVSGRTVSVEITSSRINSLTGRLVRGVQRKGDA